MKVLEIAGGPAAGFGGMLLAALGYDVVRIEPPDGGSFQAEPTVTIDEATEAYLLRGKRRASLELRTRAGAAAFVGLARNADVVIEDLGHGGLEGVGASYRRLRRANRDLVVASTSPFGLSGPRANWQASELIVQAMGGIVSSTGFEGEPGLRVYGAAAHFIAGLHLATAALAGVMGVRLGNERGAHVEVSMEEAWMQHWARHIQQWAYSGHGMAREERGAGRQGFPHTVMTADGWLYVLALNADWEPFAVFLGLEEFAARPWNEARTQVDRWHEIEPRYRASLASKPRYEWFGEAAKMGYTFAPIHDAFAVVDSPQAQARGAFETLAVGEREVPVPRLPFASPAPRLASVAAPGEHTDDVLREAGVSERAIASLRKRGITGRSEPTGVRR